MTELCDYFKIWFPLVADLHDPDDNWKIIKEETSSSLAKLLFRKSLDQNVILGFWVDRGHLTSSDFLSFLIAAGHARILVEQKYLRIEELLNTGWDNSSAFVAVESLKLDKSNRTRLIEAIELCIDLGKGRAEARTPDGKLIKSYT